MSEPASIKIKSAPSTTKPAASSATAATSTGTGAASPAVASAAVKLPELSDSPTYRVAYDNLVRLRLDLERLERQRDDYALARQAAKDEQSDQVQQVLRGTPPSEVRRAAVVADADWRKVTADIRLMRAAVEEAEKELRRAEQVAKEEACRPLAPHYREKLRAAAVAWLAYLRTAAELQEISDHLSTRSLYGGAGCESPLPRLRDGDPRVNPLGHTAGIIRLLIDAGVIDEQADAALLAGLAVAPPRPVHVEPAPTPPDRKREPGAFARALRSLGVSMAADGW